MMKLSLMKAFFDTVDADWRSPIADQIAAHWLEAADQVQCIRASANFAFFARSGERKYVLRFNHASERQPETILAELTFIEHLAGRGVRVSRPQPSLAGNLLESVPTGMGMFHAALFEFLPGEHLELSAMDATHFERWGQALGEFHRASQGFQVDGRPDWRTQLDLARRCVPERRTAFHREAQAVERKLSTLPVTQANSGLVHYDFELDNLAWSAGEVGIYDLDDCMVAWYALDISNALASELFEDRVERVNLADERVQWFLRGYRSRRDIPDEELGWMPLLLRLDNLIGYARVHRSISEGSHRNRTPVDPEPDWTTKLRRKLNRELNRLDKGFRTQIQDEE
jgi:Ser/Thr protein kinase RdoA (MazF antagonist)